MEKRKKYKYIILKGGKVDLMKMNNKLIERGIYQKWWVFNYRIEQGFIELFKNEF